MITLSSQKFLISRIVFFECAYSFCFLSLCALIHLSSSSCTFLKVCFTMIIIKILKYYFLWKIFGNILLELFYCCQKFSLSLTKFLLIKIEGKMIWFERWFYFFLYNIFKQIFVSPLSHPWMP